MAKKKAKARPKPDGLPTVVVWVEGGVVHDWTVPPGTRLIVRDHDISGVEPERIVRPELGDPYVETEYGPGA